MKQNTKRRGGFTLLELVIALAVATIISGGVFMTFRQTPQRVLRSAALQMQADIRYAQRRAMIEGRRIQVSFYPTGRMYRIRFYDTLEELRRVYLQDGISLLTHYLPSNRMTYLPRGTVSDAGSITLSMDGFTQRLTITPASGRVILLDT